VEEMGVALVVGTNLEIVSYSDWGVGKSGPLEKVDKYDDF
jgi:hypothetical protein